MISVIVCSINEQFLVQLKDNISNSIGVEYELLYRDNKIDSKGICEVYNFLAGKAKYDYLCFLHEDILFQTQNWGRKLQAIFETDPSVGAIGLAGAKFKGKAFSGWYTGMKEIDCSNISHLTNGVTEQVVLKPTANNLPEQVVCLDGVLICSTKSTWQKIRFDEDNLKGFHFYDLDFSLRAARVSKLLVIYNIDVVHITSGGDFGTKWVDTAIEYHKKKANLLPASCLQEIGVVEQAENKIVITWLDVLKNYRIRPGLKWKWILQQGLLKNPGYYYGIMKFLLYKPLGLRAVHKKKKN